MTYDSPSATAQACTDDPQDRAGEDPALDPTIECAERHGRLLKRLLEIAMTLAERVEQEALAQEVGDEAAASTGPGAGPGAGPGVDLSLKLSRISRCIRLTMALEMKTCEALRARRAGFAIECDQRRKAAAERIWRTEQARLALREQTVRETVREAIAAEHPDREDRESLEEDMLDLLGDDGDYEDMADRPIGETVARLCEALELTPDWSRWAEEDWAIEEARTRAEGSPYAAGSPAAGAENGVEGSNGFDAQHPPPHPSS